jgi:hypothetical protein
LNGKISVEGSGEVEWFKRTKSNNSLNASGISMDVIRKIGCCSAILPAALIRALETA